MSGRCLSSSSPNWHSPLPPPSPLATRYGTFLEIEQQLVGAEEEEEEEEEEGKYCMEKRRDGTDGGTPLSLPLPAPVLSRMRSRDIMKFSSK